MPKRVDPDTIRRAYHAWLEYKRARAEGRPISYKSLSEKYNISQSTLGRLFKRIEQYVGAYGEPDLDDTDFIEFVQKGYPSKDTKPEKVDIEMSKVIVRAVTDEAKDVAAEKMGQILAIGRTVVMNYFDLVQVAVRKGMTLEDFIKDVFDWYEQREMVKAYVEELETENAMLRAELDNLAVMCRDNFKFMVKVKAAQDFAFRLAYLRALGLPVNVREATRAFWFIMEQIDRDFKVLEVPEGGGD